MGASFPAKEVGQLNQQLKVQELVVSSAEPQLYTTTNAGADLVIYILEPVKKVYAALLVDSGGSPACTPVATSATSIVDSTAFTAGGDYKAVRLNSTAISSTKTIILKYSIDESI